MYWLHLGIRVLDDVTFGEYLRRAAAFARNLVVKARRLDTVSQNGVIMRLGLLAGQLALSGPSFVPGVSIVELGAKMMQIAASRRLGPFDSLGLGRQMRIVKKIYWRGSKQLESLVVFINLVSSYGK